MTNGAEEKPWPTEVRLDLKTSHLKISFDNGETYDLDAEYLRVNSPSAEVRGHGAQKPKTVAGKRHVRVTDMKEIGNYAVRLIFDDGHDTGLYSWEYLRELGRDRAKLWQTYIARLSEDGLSRGD